MSQLFKIALLNSVVFLASCASTPKADDNSEFKIEPEDKESIALVSAESETGFVDVVSPATNAPKEPTQKAQWITCKGKQDQKKDKANNLGFVLVSHDFRAGYSPNLFCKGWVAQAFLLKGFSVLTVNRPSYVGSVGRDDLSGPNSILAIHSVVKSLNIKNLIGIWGYDTGVIAASFYAKQYPEGIHWLILGGGIFDLEATLKSTDDAGLKSLSAKLKAVEGESYLEKRSIAWDYSGLPKIIGLYHAKDDTFAPISQADSFNDQLRTSEYKVFRNEINQGGHNLPWRAHMKIVLKILDQMPASK